MSKQDLILVEQGSRKMYVSSKHSRHAALVLGIVAMLALVAVAGPLARRADAHVVNISQFADPLPIPAFATPTSLDPVTGAPIYKIVMSQFKQKMAHNLPATLVWGCLLYTSPSPRD